MISVIAGIVRARLVPVVIPRVQYPDGRGTSIDLILNSLAIMTRLGWEDEKRIVALEVYEGSCAGCQKCRPSGRV